MSPGVCWHRCLHVRAAFTPGTLSSSDRFHSVRVSRPSTVRVTHPGQGRTPSQAPRTAAPSRTWGHVLGARPASRRARWVRGSFLGSRFSDVGRTPQLVGSPGPSPTFQVPTASVQAEVPRSGPRWFCAAGHTGAWPPCHPVTLGRTRAWDLFLVLSRGGGWGMCTL